MPYYEAGTDGCVGSIAEEHGFFWQTLWELPENADLKALRGDPNVLAPKDKVFVPALRQKTATASTDASYTIVRKGVPSSFKLRLLNPDGSARGGVAFTAQIDGATVTGASDDSGGISVSMPPRTRSAKVTLETGEVYLFNLGHIAPADTVRGVKARLKNLGLYSGEINDTQDDATRAAIAAFQTGLGSEATGEMDDATRTALVASYGC